MKSYKQIDLINRIAMLSALGINAPDVHALFNIEKRLNRWFTAECNGEVYRDEETDKTYRVIMCHRRGDVLSNSPCRDIETAALRKLDAIMSNYPHLVSYIQGDPRGANLYICEKSKITKERPIDNYYTDGVCVYNR
jgi:hypothetical protein